MNLLKPIKPQRISDQVLAQIRELILRGQLQPGEKLMTEREISTAMGVSRTSVRDAVNRLTAMGLLVQRQGKGTFVRSWDASRGIALAAPMESRNVSLPDLLEVRVGLECNAARLAAERADEADLDAMTDSIRQMQADFESGRLASESDIRFHMAVAFAAKNALHIWIMNSINNHLFHGNRQILGQLYQDETNLERILLQHEDILGKIKSRDPAGASDAMKAHIDFLFDFLAQHKDVQYLDKSGEIH